MKLHLRKRESSKPRLALMILLSAVIMALLLSAVFLAVKVSPLKAFWLLFSTAFSNVYHFSETLVKATPMIFTGLAVAIGLKMKLWNIGAEGQLLAGGIGAIWAAQTFSAWPAPLLIPAMMISAMICGGLLGAMVGFLKKQLNVNEILTSLMMNYIMVSVIYYLVYGPWRDPLAMNFPITPRIVQAARLPQFFGTRFHAGFFLALAFALILWFVIEKTSWGYEIRATGESKGGAKYAGVAIGRNTVLVFIICGAMAALAGMCEISGIQHKLQHSNLSAGYGNLGIIIAWLAGAHPLLIIAVATLTGALLIGADALQVSLGVSSDVVQIILGLIMCGVLCGHFFKNYRIVLERPTLPKKHPHQ